MKRLRLSIVYAGAISIGATLASPTPLRAQDTRWITTGIGPRSGHAMAHDSARGVTVLFGGADGGISSIFLGDTWEWDGTGWQRREATGPAARAGHAMAYDAVRGVMVLFGGTRTGGSLSDTREWDGTSWALRATTGPAARAYHAMIFDAARGVTVLFGGRASNQTAFADTWEWNGTTWTQRATVGPPARYAHAMAFDSARGAIVLFGGHEHYSNSYFSDTWEWNGTTWTQRATAGPAGRYSHDMAYDAAHGVSVLLLRHPISEH